MRRLRPPSEWEREAPGRVLGDRRRVSRELRQGGEGLDVVDPVRIARASGLDPADVFSEWLRSAKK